MDAQPCKEATTGSTQDPVVCSGQTAQCPLLVKVSSQMAQQEDRLILKSLGGGGRVLPDAPSLVRHQQRDHALHKPHRCATCGQTFALLSSLRLHCRAHVAPPCRRAFSPPSSLPQQHETTPDDWEGWTFGHQRHLQDGEPYACAPCGRAFSHKPALLQHQQAGCHAARNGATPAVQPPEPPVKRLPLPAATEAPSQNATLVPSPPGFHVTSQALPVTPQAPEHSSLPSPVASPSPPPSPPPSPSRPYCCSLCCREFSSQVGLASHQRLSHPAEWKQAQAAYWNQGGKRFPCPYCDKVFCHSPSLSQHKQRCNRTKGKRPTGGKVSQVKAMRVKKAGPQGTAQRRADVFPCRSCDMVFSHTSSLQLHRKEQHRRPVRPRDRGRAVAVMARTRNRGASYPCPFCGKVFAHHLTRLAHTRAHHSQQLLQRDRRDGGPPGCKEAARREGGAWRCLQCNKAYRQRGRLSRHQCRGGAHRQEAPGAREGSGHTVMVTEEDTGGAGEPGSEDAKLFPCPSCEEVFSQRGSLRKHELLHQPVREARSCGVCGNEVGVQRGAEADAARARLYHCLPCQQTFRTLQVFLRHCKAHHSPSDHSGVTASQGVTP